MTEQLRVATFNIRSSRGRDGRDRWRRRRSTCIAAIRGLSADVVGLQEVRPDQLRDLRRAFPGAPLLGAGRDADGGGEHASVLLPTDGWTADSAETRWLSLTSDRRGSVGWDAGLPRVVTLVRLRRRTTRLGIANTHLDDRGPLARQRSAELLASWLTQERDLPWVVLGDLNAVPGSAPLQALTDAGFVDALPPDTGGTEHGFTGAVDRARIDHVLVGPGIRVIAAWVSYDRPHGRLPSDHWPVVADLAVG